MGKRRIRTRKRQSSSPANAQSSQASCTSAVKKSVEVIILDDEEEEPEKKTTRSQSARVRNEKPPAGITPTPTKQMPAPSSIVTPSTKLVKDTRLSSSLHSSVLHNQYDAFPLSQSQPTNDVTWQAISPLTPSQIPCNARRRKLRGSIINDLVSELAEKDENTDCPIIEERRTPPLLGAWMNKDGSPSQFPRRGMKLKRGRPSGIKAAVNTKELFHRLASVLVKKDPPVVSAEKCRPAPVPEDDLFDTDEVSDEAAKDTEIPDAPFAPDAACGNTPPSDGYMDAAGDGVSLAHDDSMETLVVEQAIPGDGTAAETNAQSPTDLTSSQVEASQFQVESPPVLNQASVAPGACSTSNLHNPSVAVTSAQNLSCEELWTDEELFDDDSFVLKATQCALSVHNTPKHVVDAGSSQPGCKPKRFTFALNSTVTSKCGVVSTGGIVAGRVDPPITDTFSSPCCVSVSIPKTTISQSALATNMSYSFKKPVMSPSHGRTQKSGSPYHSYYSRNKAVVRGSGVNCSGRSNISAVSNIASKGQASSIASSVLSSSGRPAVSHKDNTLTKSSHLGGKANSLASKTEILSPRLARGRLCTNVESVTGVLRLCNTSKADGITTDGQHANVSRVSDSSRKPASPQTRQTRPAALQLPQGGHSPCPHPCGPVAVSSPKISVGDISLTDDLLATLAEPDDMLDSQVMPADLCDWEDEDADPQVPSSPTDLFGGVDLNITAIPSDSHLMKTRSLSSQKSLAKQPGLMTSTQVKPNTSAPACPNSMKTTTEASASFPLKQDFYKSGNPIGDSLPRPAGQVALLNGAKNLAAEQTFVGPPPVKRLKTDMKSVCDNKMDVDTAFSSDEDDILTESQLLEVLMAAETQVIQTSQEVACQEKAPVLQRRHVVTPITSAVRVNSRDVSSSPSTSQAGGLLHTTAAHTQQQSSSDSVNTRFQSATSQPQNCKPPAQFQRSHTLPKKQETDSMLPQSKSSSSESRVERIPCSIDQIEKKKQDALQRRLNRLKLASKKH